MFGDHEKAEGGGKRRLPSARRTYIHPVQATGFSIIFEDMPPLFHRGSHPARVSSAGFAFTPWSTLRSLFLTLLRTQRPRQWDNGIRRERGWQPQSLGGGSQWWCGCGNQLSSLSS